eukprot:TRINITY_DN773_c0_g1_i1.p1 TRINITY_DN773_c0_g1~~TRINITY_DN773_c0_g1_i1.p1  ORF type:complete len:183 (+),score=47.51 TRINITY_DN773_c0_g1_i1:150-698(+)
MKALLVTILFSLLLVSIFAQSSNDVLQAEKTVTSGKNGIYTVKVGYRSTVEPTRAFNVKIVDTLPPTLELVSGSLVVIAEEPTQEWNYNTYTVRASNIHFTLDKRSVEVTLPASEILFTRDPSAASYEETLKTETVSLTASLVVPEGNINYLTAAVAFFTLVLPVAAPILLIPYFQGSKKRQ